MDDANPHPQANVVAMSICSAATADITPEFGVSLNGTILKSGPAKSVHDRLHARALVLNDGRTRLAVVVCERTISCVLFVCGERKRAHRLVTTEKKNEPGTCARFQFVMQA